MTSVLLVFSFHQILVIEFWCLPFHMKLQLLALLVNKPQLQHAWESEQAQKSLKSKCRMYAVIWAFPIISIYSNMNYPLNNRSDSSCVRQINPTLQEAQFWVETTTNFMQQDVKVAVSLFTAQAVSRFLQPGLAGAFWARNKHSLIYPMGLPVSAIQRKHPYLGHCQWRKWLSSLLWYFDLSQMLYCTL